MKQYDLEKNILACIFLKTELINELYVEPNCFEDDYNKQALLYLKSFYQTHKTLDLVLIAQDLLKKTNKDITNRFINYCTELNEYIPSTAQFYEYQQELIERHKTNLIKKEVNEFINNKLAPDDLIEKINSINNETMVITKQNKKSPQEMLELIRNKKKLINFIKFEELNKKIQIKKNTVNVIGARPSEGKSALALNLFCDLSRNYKTIYFNMEMTEAEVYERMLAIESNVNIQDIIKPQTDYQNEHIKKIAHSIYSLNYEVVNGSKTVSSIKNKIIREQRNGHVVVFIDYIGYIVGKRGQNDRERIGEAVRELNNITKDYDCTIFLIAQINRGGSETPTMEDLKDSGEIEQTADTIILIHDGNKTDVSDEKEVNLIIPKCRGGKRFVQIRALFNKPAQIFKIREDKWKR